MIIFTPKTVVWESDDASRLKSFLESSTGQRMLQIVEISKPELLDGAHKNKTLVASGAVAGHQNVVETIFRLTYENPNEPVVPDAASTNYKSLDDDSEWVDVDKATVDKSEKPPTS